MDWYEVTGKCHARTFDHEGRLSSLPHEWQRELAALWRLEADVNNGAYLQFLANWGRESSEHAIRGLKRIGAATMASIIEQCQNLVDEHFDANSNDGIDPRMLLPNPITTLDGVVVKNEGSCLPDSVVDRILDLSYEFMDYPDDIAGLGLDFYGPLINTEPGK